MNYLHEVERALELHHEGERLRQEYTRALSERVTTEKESRQVEDLIATLEGPEPLSRELLLRRAPRSPKPMQVQVEFDVRLNHGDKGRHPNE